MHLPNVITVPLAIVVLSQFLPLQVGNAQALSAIRNRLIEIELTSSRSYGHPVNDVELSCEFVSPQGRRTTVLGFWDGGSTYRVRFSADVTGSWTYRTWCNDSANTGLHHRSGVLHVRVSPDETPLETLGLPRVSPDKRYFVSANGEPWFYLADTAWELTWKSTMDELRAYLSDRKSKKFNAIQFCVISHMLNGPNGLPNQRQQTTFLNDDLTLPNPGYFTYLDTLVRMMNDSGMVASMVPLWAWFAEPHRDDPRFDARFFSEREAVAWATYIGARYAGHNVIWIVAGDKNYNTPIQQHYWTTFATALRRADGGRHLTTLHTGGSSASFDYFDSTAQWLDFHMYQSSHALQNTSPWSIPLRGWSLPGTKPMLDGETVYEDLFDQFWLYDEHADSAKLRRFRDEDVRRTRYEGVLSGAIAGTTYGANGVYQWNVERLPEPGKFPHYLVLDALKMRVAGQMAVVKDLMTMLSWHAFVPAPHSWTATIGTEFIPTSQNSRFLVSYFAHGISPQRYVYDGPAITCYAWFNPRNGTRARAIGGFEPFVAGRRIEKPDSSDWLFVGAYRTSDLVDLDVTLDTARRGEDRDVGLVVYPDPLVHSGILEFSVTEPAPVQVHLMDCLGRVLRNLGDHRGVGGSVRLLFDAGDLPSGIYFLAIRSENRLRTVPFVKLRR